MKTTCPACGAVTSMDALIGHEAARSCLVRALEQTPVGKRLIRYVALFRPDKRQLSWDRVSSILTELLDWIEAGKIERHGRIWAAPHEYWTGALDEMLARRDSSKLTLPLKSHGYLLEIITGYANKSEAKQEEKQEEKRRTSYREIAKPEAVSIDPEVANAARQAMKKIVGSKKE
jgi:uncharacterized protein YdbL (DUF1318 family)